MFKGIQENEAISNMCISDMHKKFRGLKEDTGGVRGTAMELMKMSKQVEIRLFPTDHYYL